MTNEVYMAESHLGREVVYACLSRLFLEVPNEEIFKMLEDIIPYISQLKTDSDDDKLLNEGIKGLEGFVNRRNALSNEAKADFDMDTARQFTRVFCMTDSAATSESVYLSPEHLMMQEEEIKVSRIYESCNFSMENESNEPYDHISYELMFMSFLAKGTAYYLSKSNTDEADKLLSLQVSFLEEHILKWVEDFVRSCLKFPESYNLYLPAAYFIAGFMKIDLEFLTK